MKRFTSIVRKRSGPAAQGNEPIDPNAPPEANAVRGVRLFCDSGSQNSNQGEGQEYLHLPTIVESAESSPVAAKAAAHEIRKLIKDGYSKPYVQYNAIMLIRILTDNPGQSFTKNIDDKFISTLRSLLQQGRDPSVKQILIETLHALETQKSYDQNLIPLTTMWLKERSMMMTAGVQPARVHAAWGPPNPAQGVRASSRPAKQLPPPAELAGRIEEARTSAQLLTQLTQTTPASQVLQNELMNEFAQRCQNSQRSLQGYMNCTEPAPDEQTFQTLIEVSEQVNIAMSRHQRAVLAARRGSAQSPPPAVSSPPPTGRPTAPPLESHPVWQQQQQQQQSQQQQQPQQERPLSGFQPLPPVPVETESYDPTWGQRSNNPFLAAPRSPPLGSTNGTSKQQSTSNPPTSTLSNKPFPMNPFSDENKIPSRSGSSQQVPNAQSAVKTPAQPSSEIGATLGGPAPHSSLPHSATNLENEDFEPPPGPPPKRTNTQPLAEPFSYDSSAPRVENRAVPEAEDDLYGTRTSPMTPVRPQASTSTNGNVGAPYAQYGSPSQPPSAVNSSGAGRIIDDEPISPMAPGSWETNRP